MLVTRFVRFDNLVVFRFDLSCNLAGSFQLFIDGFSNYGGLFKDLLRHIITVAIIWQHGIFHRTHAEVS